jgi:hypothetical protein
VLRVTTVRWISASIGLQSDEVAVGADIGHAGEDVCQRPAPWTEQCLLEDLAVLLLGAAVMLRSTPFERLDQLVVQVTHHQLSQGSPP